MKLKYLFWYILVGFWILWLCLISMKAQDTNIQVVADKLATGYTQRKIENTNYILLNEGSEVTQGQLIAYNIDSFEISQLQLTLEILGSYSDIHSLKSSLLKLKTNDESVNIAIANVLAEIPPLSKKHSKVTKQDISIQKKAINKIELIQMAEKALSEAQIRYSKREIDLNILKKYVEKLKMAKESPEYISVTKKLVSKPSNTVAKINKPNAQLQEMIYLLTNKVQDKLAKAEIKSPASGVLKMDSTAQLIVLVPDTETEIEFGMNVNSRHDKVLEIAIECANNEIYKTRAFAQNAEGKYNYKFKISANKINACTSNNSQHVQVLFQEKPQSLLCELVEKIRKTTCE